VEFNDIFSSFKELGIGGLVVSTITFIMWLIEKTFGLPHFITNIFYKIIDIFLKRRMPELKEVQVLKENDIQKHDIFGYIDYWIYVNIPSINFSTEFRTLVFRKYLTIFLQTHKVNIYSFVHEKEFEHWESAEFWTNILGLINKIVVDYEKEMKLAGIPDVVIQKMKEKNNDIISLTIDLISTICNSQFYSTDKNLLKVYSILNIFLSILENTISASEKICASINGELKGLSMDGKIEP
jgi:hypothetical protein